MSKDKKLGLGIVIGAVAGLVTGLLAAPKSGQETRKDLKKKANEVKGSAERKLKEAQKELGKLSDEAKTATAKLQGKAKAELEDLSSKADDLKDRVKNAITSIKSGDDEDDDATVDQLLKDLDSIKKKISSKLKS